MKYTFDKLKLLLLAVGIVFAGFIFTVFRIGILQPNDNGSYNPQTTVSLTPPEKIKAGLLVEFEGGKTILYEDVEVNVGESAYSLLTKKMNETGSVVTTKSYDFGMMVESIDGISASSTHFWSYSVNGVAGNISADKYILQNGDVVEWKYTPIQ